MKMMGIDHLQYKEEQNRLIYENFISKAGNLDNKRMPGAEELEIYSSSTVINYASKGTSEV